MEELMNIHAHVGSGSAGSQGPLGGMPELAGADMKSLKQQADTLWRFLDELSESDPAQYARFIEKQAAAASSESASMMQVAVRDAQPLVALELPVAAPSKQQPSAEGADKQSNKAVHASHGHQLAVVHVWAARNGTVVPEARTSAGPITASTSAWSGAIIPITEAREAQQLATSHHYHAAVHPAVVDMITAGQPGQLRAVLAVGLGQWVISKYKVMPVGNPLLKVHASVLAPPVGLEDKNETAIVRELASLASTSTMQPAEAVAQPKGKQIIQEIGSTHDTGVKLEVLQVEEQERGGKAVMLVHVCVPGVSSTRDVDLEFVGNTAIRLTMHATHAVLEVQLPRPADPGSCKAKLDMSSSTLKISVAPA